MRMLLPILSLLLLASHADAQGPIRRLLFGQRAVQRCNSTANSTPLSSSKSCPCEVCPDCKECCKDVACDVPKVSGAKKDDGLIWLTPKEFESILVKLD